MKPGTGVVALLAGILAVFKRRESTAAPAFRRRRLRHAERGLRTDAAVPSPLPARPSHGHAYSACSQAWRQNHTASQSRLGSDARTCKDCGNAIFVASYVP